MIPRVWSKLLAISEHTLWGSGLCIAPLLSGYLVHLTVSHTAVAISEQCHRCLQKYLDQEWGQHFTFHGWGHWWKSWLGLHFLRLWMPHLEFSERTTARRNEWELKQVQRQHMSAITFFAVACFVILRSTDTETPWPYICQQPLSHFSVYGRSTWQAPGSHAHGVCASRQMSEANLRCHFSGAIYLLLVLLLESVFSLAGWMASPRDPHLSFDVGTGIKLWFCACFACALQTRPFSKPSKGSLKATGSDY